MFTIMGNRFDHFMINIKINNKHLRLVSHIFTKLSFTFFTSSSCKYLDTSLTSWPASHTVVVGPKGQVVLSCARFLTCRVKYSSVVEHSVDQEVVGCDTELSTAVLVTAVSRDDGEQLHLKADTQLLRGSKDREVWKHPVVFSAPFGLTMGRGIWWAGVPRCSFCQRSHRCTVASLWRGGASLHLHLWQMRPRSNW